MNVPHNVELSTQVSGIDRKFSFLTIPLGTPNLKEAVDNALEQSNGAVALTNVKIRYKYWNLLLFGANWYEIEGNPVFEKQSQNK